LNLPLIDVANTHFLSSVQIRTNGITVLQRVSGRGDFSEQDGGNGELLIFMND